MTNLFDPRNLGGQAPAAPQSRYILPSFIEHSSYGVKESNPYNKLFEERIIFLGVQVDDASANDVMAQLLVLESLDPDRDITMYINSPGGSFTSLMAIYDTMQYVRADITTVCLGQAAERSDSHELIRTRSGTGNAVHRLDSDP
jgi:ATP-dependent Clp protease protease subunit